MLTTVIFFPFERLIIRSADKSNNAIDYADSQEDKTCKSSQTREMNQSDELSETSMVEFVAEMDISPDDVVRMIGEKHFWKARRAIAE